MPLSPLNVFDFDGTIIRVNSFREITKRLVRVLLNKGRLPALLELGALYALRRCRLISHLSFKERVVAIFERSLTEPEKKRVCQAAFDVHVNRAVYDRLLSLSNCIICTASPFAYVSRISLAKQVPVICALDPGGRWPDRGNNGRGKAVNLRAFLGREDIHIDCFHTDNPVDDRALVDLAKHTYLVDRDRMEQLK